MWHESITLIPRAIGHRLLWLANKIDHLFPNPQRDLHAAWREADGDRTLRLDYPLGIDDVVLDVGGFEGQWASDIYARYRCKIHIFEPVPQFYKKIVARFACNPDIAVHSIGLGAQEEIGMVSVSGDASSFFRPGTSQEQVPVAAMKDWCERHDVGEVALMKINIEGSEYPLLEHIIDTGLIKQIRELQIQFHDFVPDAQSRMQEIQNRLSETHSPTWQYHYIWENWKRKA